MKYLFFLLSFFLLKSETFDSRLYSFRSPQDGFFIQQVYQNLYTFNNMFIDNLQPFAVLPIRNDSVFDEYINIVTT